MSAPTQDPLLKLFTESRALLSGHFKLSSGLHSDQYFQCALLLADPPTAEKLGKALAKAVEALERPDIVVSPALGGVVIGHEAARALGTRSLFAERVEGAMALRRGFALKPGEKVLVVEDVITTGKSTSEVIQAVSGLGARVVGAASIVVRADKDPALGVPLSSLARIPVRSWEPEKCPLCAEGRPLVKPGSRPG